MKPSEKNTRGPGGSSPRCGKLPSGKDQAQSIQKGQADEVQETRMCAQVILG